MIFLTFEASLSFQSLSSLLSISDWRISFFQKLGGIWAVSWQNQRNDCAPSEDSDQPGHPSSLIRVFAVRMKKPWVLSYPSSAQRRLWSDWADVQADLSLGWAHSHFVGFVVSWLKWKQRWATCLSVDFKVKWAAAWQNQQNYLFTQQRLRSAWASAKSDQSLCCQHEERLCPYLPIKRTVKTLIRLNGYPGWSVTLLGAQVLLLVLACCSSNHSPMTSE